MPTVTAATIAAISTVCCAACGTEHTVDARPWRDAATEVCDVWGCVYVAEADGYRCPCGAILLEDDIAQAIDAAYADPDYDGGLDPYYDADGRACR